MANGKMKEKAQSDLVVGSYTIKPNDPNYAGYKEFLKQTSPQELERHLQYKGNIMKVENGITRESYLLELEKSFNMRRTGNAEGADQILSNLDRFLKNRGIMESKPVPTGEKGLGKTKRSEKPPEPTEAAGNIAEAEVKRKVEVPKVAEEEFAVPELGGGADAVVRRKPRKPETRDIPTTGKPKEKEEPAEPSREAGTPKEVQRVATMATDPLTFEAIMDLESAWHFESYDGKREYYFSSGKGEEEITKYLLGRGLAGNLCLDDKCVMVAPVQAKPKTREKMAAKTGEVAYGQVQEVSTLQEAKRLAKESGARLTVLIVSGKSESQTYEQRGNWWCGPCGSYAPTVRTVAAKYDDVLFLEGSVPGSWSGSFSEITVNGRNAVTGVPATIIIDSKGEMVTFRNGGLSAADLQALIG